MAVVYSELNMAVAAPNASAEIEEIWYCSESVRCSVWNLEVASCKPSKLHEKIFGFGFVVEIARKEMACGTKKDTWSHFWQLSSTYHYLYVLTYFLVTLILTLLGI